jgi:hypothetical protein
LYQAIKTTAQQHSLQHLPKVNIMTTKQFDVTYINPFSGREVTEVEVSANYLSQNDSGETVFRMNDFHPACEVVRVVEVSQARLDAKAAYFARWGTANE